jgi:hypothetical protein
MKYANRGHTSASLRFESVSLFVGELDSRLEPFLSDGRLSRGGQGTERSQIGHVEADVDEPFMLQETQHLLTLADQSDNPLEAIVACGRPENQDFRSYLDKIAAHSRVKFAKSRVCSISIL